MKQKKVLKEWIARRLDEKDFHTQVSKCLLETAQSNNLLLIFSDHLDFIRFDGAFYDYVYATHRFISPETVLCETGKQRPTLWK